MTPWTRKEIIGDCALYLGNAMEIMPHLAKADLAISDVPYSLTTGGVSKSSKTMSGIFAAHNYANDGQLIMATVPFPEMMAAIHGALVANADCYVMANDKNVHPLTAAALDSGFQFHNLLVWDKVTPTPNRWVHEESRIHALPLEGQGSDDQQPFVEAADTGRHR
jgi:DNA modification methylase